MRSEDRKAPETNRWYLLLLRELRMHKVPAEAIDSRQLHSGFAGEAASPFVICAGGLAPDEQDAIVVAVFCWKLAVLTQNLLVCTQHLR